MRSDKAEFAVGQIIHHKLFRYRGVIIDVDATYQRTDEWYDMMAKSKPAKGQPWYHVLVDDTEYITYVAEQNIERDKTNIPVIHPDLNKYFSKRNGGTYIIKYPMN